jgi:hypothetical protein
MHTHKSRPLESSYRRAQPCVIPTRERSETRKPLQLGATSLVAFDRLGNLSEIPSLLQEAQKMGTLSLGGTYNSVKSP